MGEGGTIFQKLTETRGAESTVICAGEEPAAGGQHAETESGERREVVLDTEDFAIGIPAEGWGIEDDSIPKPALFGKTAEPLEGVAPAEEMGIGIEGVQNKIPLSPIQIRAG